MTTAKNKSSRAAPGGTRWRGHGWFIAGLVLVLAFNVVIRIRLAATPLERDEGEYAYTGQLLLQGIPPYKLAYNMKFPGTYGVYAALMAICGETTRGIHIGIAIVTSLTAILVGLMGRRLFGAGAGVLGAASYVLLAATPAAFGLAGHATHFVALFSTAGALVLVQAGERPAWWRWSLAGLLFGVAILMKQHAVLMAGGGLVWLGWWSWQQRARIPSKDRAKILAAYGSGCIAPLLVTGITLVAVGVGKPFLFWTIQYAAQYASAVSIQTAGSSFQNGFGPVFVATWPLWVIGLSGLGAVWASRDRIRTSMGIVLLGAGMLAAVPGYHFRGHYFLAALPGLALLIAATGAAAWQRITMPPGRALIASLLGSGLAVTVWNNREIWFQLTPEQVARREYSLNPFAEAPKVADYLRKHTAVNERIAVVGSEPQIYFHANRPAATGYIYMYALTEPQPYAQRMREEFAREIETANPRYIVFVDIITSWVSLSAADTTVLSWWNQLARNYEPVAAVALSADQPTRYIWDEAVVRTLDLTEYHLIVYRRKP